MQYLKKEVSEEVDRLHADKDQTFLQVDTIILEEMASHAQSTENKKFTNFLFWALWAGLAIATSEEWSGMLIKPCHGNNLLHISIKDYYK